MKLSHSFVKNSKSVGILFGASIFDKFFGFFRELFISMMFGSAPVYASYLSISVIVDAFMVFTGDAALQANLIPRFSKLFNQTKINTNALKRKIFRIAGYVVLINIVLIILFMCIRGFVDYWIPLTIILGLSIGFYVLNVIGLILLQAKGDFFQYSKGTIVNSGLAAILVIPFSFLWGIIGLALSRLVSIASVYVFAWPKKHQSTDGEMVKIGIRDFNWKIICTANFYVILILVSKLFFSLKNDINITHYNYSAIVFGIVITTLIRSISTILLRFSSIKSNVNILKHLPIMIVLSSIIGIFFYFFSFDIIKLLFQRGAFTENDTFITNNIFQHLIIPFMLQIIALLLMQPVLASADHLKTRFVNVSGYTIIGVVLILLGMLYFSNMPTLLIIYILIYSISILQFFYSLIFNFKIQIFENRIP